MTTTSTLHFRRITSTLAGIFLSFQALAQTAPTWTSASPTGLSGSLVGDAAVDAAGNTYVTGSFNTPSFVLEGVTLTTRGANDGYLAKYTAVGTLAWVRQLGSTGSDATTDVAVDAAGNAYVSGFAGASLDLGNGVVLNGSVSRAFVVRYSPQGTPEWAQESSTGSGASLGTDAAGHVYLTGFFSRSVSFGSASTATPNNAPGVYLARFSAATGAVQSLITAYYFAPVGAGNYPFPKLAVSPTGETSIFNAFSQPAVAGNTTYTSRGGNDVLVTRYNAQGTFLWAQQFGGPAADFAFDGALDATGNVYVVGEFTGPATFGTTTLPGAGDTDGYLLKYSPQGTMEWVQPLASPGFDVFSSVSLDAAGNPYVAGSFFLGAQAGTVILNNLGGRDIVVAAFTPQGQVRWTQLAGGSGFELASHLGISADGTLHVLGRYSGTCFFGPLYLTTTANTETFLARLSSIALAGKAAQPLALGCYPNPATDMVHLPTLAAGTSVQLLDALGRQVRAATVTAAAQVSVRGLAPGLYILRATDGQGRQLAARVTVE